MSASTYPTLVRDPAAADDYPLFERGWRLRGSRAAVRLPRTRAACRTDLPGRPRIGEVESDQHSRHLLRHRVARPAAQRLLAPGPAGRERRQTAPDPEGAVAEADGRQ